MTFNLIGVYRNSMLPHPKKLKRNGPSATAAAETSDRIAAPEIPNTNADDRIIDDPLGGMSIKLTSRILGFLGYKDIMRSRICCKKFRDAARTTMVPWHSCFNVSYSRAIESQFHVDSEKKYKAMVAMTTALPNLQQLRIWDLGSRSRHKYCDGEDPDKEQAAATADWTTHDIQIISKFRHLRRFEISTDMLNGRYPVLFNFPFLQSLDIVNCFYLKWDLEMLAGLPSLKELFTIGLNKFLTGNIRSLRMLKNTLEKLCLCGRKIEGDFMDLADFPRLKSLRLAGCSMIRGDMRAIGENDFSTLEELELGKLVIGARSHEFQRTSDVPSVAVAIYRLKQRDPPLVKSLQYIDIGWRLSRDSPEWYASSEESGHPPPPFSIEFVHAGSRVGWRWKRTAQYNHCANSCEINWLDPEPDRESSGYEVYNRELQSIEEDIFCFEGYHQPPSEDDYKRLCEEYYGI